MKVLLTGAGGHVGPLLLRALKQRGHEVTALSRRPAPHLADADSQVVAELGPQTDFEALLADVAVVVHLADGFNVYEHLPADTRVEEAQRRLQTTTLLAEAAARRGLHLVYLSTIKAMCGASADEVLRETTPARPDSLYGRLKLAAETAMTEAVKQYGGSAVMLRFPIVFGTGRPDGNLERLVALAATPLPLPFKGLTARRSLISATSLAEAAVLAVETQADGAESLLLHDGALSIDELVSVLRHSLGRPRHLFPLPAVLWRAAERLPVAGRIASRFTRPLEIDDSRFRQRFDWQPSAALETRLEAFAAACAAGKQ